MAKQKVDMVKMTKLFEQAAETGIFDFELVSYEDWIKFMSANSRVKTISFGKRDPAFVAEVKRLAGVARELAKLQPAPMSAVSEKLLNKFQATAVKYGYLDTEKSTNDFSKAKEALATHIAGLEATIGALQKRQDEN